MQLNVSANIDELSWRAAEWMIDHMHQTLKLQDRFTIALSGGSTPKKLHLLLASDEFKNKVDWQKLHVFWGDERYVPFDDARNNAKMAFDTLLDHVAVPKPQIHIMRTDIDANQAANEYEQTLKEYFSNAATQFEARNRQDSLVQDANTFDLVILGLGDNAHTLSLFPGEAVVHETNSWVQAVFVKEVNMERITLTAPVVNLARKIVFLVSGNDKAGALAHILYDKYAPDLYPAQVINPVNGELYWFLDQAAAAKLKDD
jgi:6-phosphogluconolactonase